MEETTRPSLLIAISKGFEAPAFFARKMSRLLETMENPEVAVVQDTLSIARDYFAKRGNSVRDEKSFSRTNARRRLREYSHVVVFWDGDDLTDIVFSAQLNRIPLRVVPVQVTKVRNKDNDEPFDVYIGRGTPWGNPFPIGVGGVGDTREDVIRKYRQHFAEKIIGNEEMRQKLLSLRGYRLGCHCKPAACHGDVIAEYLNSDDALADDS